MKGFGYMKEIAYPFLAGSSAIEVSSEHLESVMSLQNDIA